MQGAVREHLFEAVVGLAVVLLAGWFLFFAWQRTGGGLHETIRVKALFPAAAGVAVGTDVRIAGLKVGSVVGQRLDPESYQAELTMALDGKVKVPSDSSAAITSEGLLGGTFVALQPGGADTPLKNGDTILDTQGSVDMMGLIGSFINNPKSSEGSGSGSGAAGGTMSDETLGNDMAADAPPAP